MLKLKSLPRWYFITLKNFVRMKINLLLLIIIASLNWSCNNKNTQTNQSPEVDSLVTVSVQQFRTMNMVVGGGT